jgi:flagellar operon protein
MDLKKVSTFDSMMTPEKVGGVRSNPTTSTPVGGKGGPSFEDMLNQIQGGVQPAVTGGIAKPMATPNIGAAQGIKFSNHAVERMQTRGVSFNKQDIDRLNEAVDRAAAKGSKDTLVLMNDAALIVSVKNKTVVTVMDKAALKENVFTNIDSTIVM